MMQQLPQVTVQQLDYLVAVSDSATWAEAAGELGVTPSALSQGLAELERRLGLPLFERRGRRRVVAPASAPVVEYARMVLAQTGDLGRWIEATTTGHIGAVRVGMIDAAAVHHFSRHLLSFRRSHPEIDFTLAVAPSAELIERLIGNELDVVIVVRPVVQPPTVDLTPLMEEPLAVYAPEGIGVGPPPTWGPWVLFPSRSRTRQLTEEALVKLGAPTRVVAESNQPDVLREMVRLGLGWTVLPVIQAETEPTPLRRVRAEPLFHRSLVVAERRGAIPNPLVRTLTDGLTPR